MYIFFDPIQRELQDLYGEGTSKDEKNLYKYTEFILQNF